MLVAIRLLLHYSLYFYSMQQLDLFAAFETAKPESNTAKPVVDIILQDTAAPTQIETPAIDEAAEIDTVDNLPDEVETFSANEIIIADEQAAEIIEAPIGEDEIITTEEYTAEIIEVVAVEDTVQADETPFSAKEEDVAIDLPNPNVEIKQPAKVKSTGILPEAKVAGKRGRKSYSEMDADIVMVEVPDDEVLFSKQYYGMSEVAQWFHVNQSLLRYWENEFDILKPRKTRKGDRLFRPEDIKNLQLIYFLLRQRKFSLEGAKQYLKDNKQKADVNMKLIQSLTKFRAFLLEWKANLGA